MGVKWSLLTGFLLSTVGRIIMASTHSRALLWTALYGFIPISAGFSGTVLIIGIKRYANPAGRGFAFGLYYAIINVAALLNGTLYDVFRVNLKDGLNISGFQQDSVLNDGMRLYMLAAGVWGLLAFFISLFIDDSQAVDLEEGAAEKERIDARQTPQSIGGAIQSHVKSIGKFFSDIRDVFSIVLVKYLIVCLLTINLKQIFRHLDATLPKYQTRAFGCDVRVGLIYSINPFLIILLVPPVQAMLTKFNHYDVIHFGSYISGISAFAMVFWQTNWASAVFVVLLSLGESIWSPRWYDYSMSIAPRGREAIFSAAAAAPLFFAKLPTGYLSGWLLQKWCPNNRACTDSPLPLDQWRPCQGRYVWLVIGLLTLSTPICLLLGSRWLRSTGERQEKHSGEALEAKEALVADEAEPMLEGSFDQN